MDERLKDELRETVAEAIKEAEGLPEEQGKPIKRLAGVIDELIRQV